MKKHIGHIIKIENPCNEDLTKMSSNSNGKYCSHCSKNVIDFTHLTDNEIIRILEKSSEKLCGQFANDQLNRTLIQVPEKQTNLGFYKILGGLLLLSTAGNSVANGLNSKFKRLTQFRTENVLIQKTGIKNKSPQPSDTLKNIIQGKITDKTTGETLVDAILEIKSLGIGTSTDLDGNYKLIIPLDLLKDTILIQVLYLGYEKVEFSITKGDLPLNKEISLSPYILKKEIHQNVGAIISETFMIRSNTKPDNYLKKKKKWWRIRANRK